MKALALLAASTLTLAAATTHFVTVAGLGGEPDYEQRFQALARDLDKLLKGGGGDVSVHTFSGAEATRERLKSAFETIARQAKTEDALVLMLIGHGSFDGYDYKINLPGADVSGFELAALLDRGVAGRQLVVNMTSASGGSVPALMKENRSVISATRTGSEKNATVFARYWVEALRDAAADTDKNEVITALEAFRYADQKTARYYDSQKRLATEHAVLEDTGKGEAARAPSVENGQGKLAGRFALVRLGSMQKAAADPAKRKLAERKEEIELAIDQLKYEKAALPLEEYRWQLGALLLELARIQEELDK